MTNESVLDRRMADPMHDPVVSLLCDMLEWIAKEDRSYAEVMEAWRTSCPRLPVWEEANERRLVSRTMRGGVASVTVTAEGHAYLERRRVNA